MSPEMQQLAVIAGYVTIVLVALAVIGTLVMAVMSKGGRDGLAVLGVRVADALVRFFERRLNEQHAVTRGLRR